VGRAAGLTVMLMAGGPVSSVRRGAVAQQ